MEFVGLTGLHKVTRAMAQLDADAPILLLALFVRIEQSVILCEAIRLVVILAHPYYGPVFSKDFQTL
jgi:hypothetical protein